MAQPPAQRFYLPQLDGLRFLAFFLVLLHHLPRANAFFPPGSLVAGFVARLQVRGWIGVEIFLVVSSFLIFSLLLQERRRTGTIAVGAFYARRALRIWPLYYFYLALALLVVPWFLRLEAGTATVARYHLLPFLTLTGNFSYAYFPDNLTAVIAHLWTISLEEQFYLVVPLIVFFGAPLRRHALAIAVGALVLASAFRFYVLSNAIPYPMVWVNPACRLDPFVVGAACAWARHRRPDVLRGPLGIVFAVLALVGFAIFALFPNVGTSIHTTWQMTVVALASGALVMAVTSSALLARVFSMSPIVYLGKISYGLYIYHQVAILLTDQTVMPALGLGVSALSWMIGLGISLAITVVVASVSYHAFERRFVLIKHRFEKIRSRPA